MPDWSQFGVAAAGAGLGMGLNLLQGSISGLINNAFYKRNLGLQVEAQKDLMKYQNDYNSPSAQMQRLQEAGLNPNLVYGSNAPSGVSGNASAPSGVANPGNYNTADIISEMVGVAQTEQMEANKEALLAKAEYDRANAQYINTQNARYNERVNQEISESKARIENLAKQNNLADSSIQLNEAKRTLAVADELYRRGEIGLQTYEKRKLIAEINLFQSEKSLKESQKTYTDKLSHNAKVEGFILKNQWKYERIVKSPFMAREQKKAELQRLKKQIADDSARIGIDGSKTIQWTNYLFDRYEQVVRIGNTQAKTIQGFMP